MNMGLLRTIIYIAVAFILGIIAAILYMSKGKQFPGFGNAKETTANP